MGMSGGQPFLHGYTHQYDTTPNPYNGRTGDDCEFLLASWDEASGESFLLGPVPEDSVGWVNDRIDRALAELSAVGITPVGWETPHYVASALDYREFAKRFALTSGRVLYTSPMGTDYLGQFFPYLIERDIYGQKILPENLGNVSLVPFYDYPAHSPADIVRAAEKNLVVRDGWAAAYFHPDIPLTYLMQIIDGVRALGYTYTSAPTLVADAGPDKTSFPSQPAVLEGGASGGVPPYAFSWSRSTDLSDPSAGQPVASPASTTTYTLTVTDSRLESDTDTVTVAVSAFPDVPGSSWACDETLACARARIIQGYSDDLYHPDWPVTRDQIAVYVARALAGGEDNVPDGPAEAAFEDVPTDYWAYDHVEYCYDQKVVQGYTATTYEPALEVTRDQMAVYVTRALVAPTGDAALADYVPTGPRNFPDIPSDFWAYKQIEYCVENGVVQGYDDGLYHPDWVVTRDQMAVYVARAFDLLAR